MNFVGDAIDSKYGTNTTPYLRFFGGMFGGGLGAGSMYRNTAHITSKLTNIKENGKNKIINRTESFERKVPVETRPS